MATKFDQHMEQASIYLRRRMLVEALAEYQEVLKIAPRTLKALNAVAAIYGYMGKKINAYRALNRIVELYGDETPIDIRSRLFELEKNFVFWDNLDREIKYFTSPNVLNSGQVNPFYIGAHLPLSNEKRYKALRTFVSESPELRLKPCPFSFEDRKLKPKKIKLGFLCADIRPHPTGYVIGEFFERIDREKFDVYLYDIHPELDSYPSKRIYAIKDINIVQLDKLNDKAAAERIFEDKIDVLVDMNGFTSFNRLGIMTYQPAPAQGTFLGYIGTMGGVPGIDYHFVDQYSVLPGEEKYYHETLKYLEPARWLIDHNIELPKNAPLRKHMGFKSDTVVLCCFNNTYKFTPTYFDLWARILKRVPKAILWFYGNSQILEENIDKEFEKRGIEKERIIHSKFVPHEEHLARYKIADLLLDTEIYNAHTTGMEALFMGCPVITCPGTTYPSRVGGALLTALDLPELICKDVQEYEEKVVKLCTTPGALKKLREKVTEKITKAPLFNTEKFTRSFEKAVCEMYDECIKDLNG